MRANFWRILVAAHCLVQISAQASNEDDELYFRGGMLDKLLNPTRYDKQALPKPLSGPLIVNVSIYTMSVSSISEISMDFRLDIFLRQVWHDSRLNYTSHPDYQYIMVHPDRTGEVWIPDTFIRNEKEYYSHSVTVPNKIMRLHPDGVVFFSQRIGLKLSCNMNIRLFPFDNQTCNMQLESLSHTTKYLKYQWAPIPWETKQKTMAEFIFMGFVVQAACDGQYSTGVFSCIDINFGIKRHYGYYIIQTYIPTVLIVIISWATFWLDVHAVPARTYLGLTTVLNLTTLSIGLSNSLPKVSYIKAIELWVFVSQVFVFGAVLEFAIANVLDRKIEARLKRLASRPKPEHLATDGVINPAFDPSFDSDLSTEIPTNASVKSFTPTPKKKREIKFINSNYENILDTISKFVFPSFYVFFCLVYWLYHLDNSGYI